MTLRLRLYLILCALYFTVREDHSSAHSQSKSFASRTRLVDKKRNIERAQRKWQKLFSSGPAIQLLAM